MKRICFLLGLLLVASAESFAYAQPAAEPAPTPEPAASPSSPSAAPASALAEAASTKEPATSATTPNDAKEPPKRRTGFSVMGDMSYAYRDLFGIPVHAGEAQLALGGMKRIVGFYGALGVMAGATEHGLTIVQVTLAFTVLFNVSDRFRLAVSAPRLSYLRVDRVTDSKFMTTGGLGAAASAYYDFAQLERTAFYISLKASVDGHGTENNATAINFGITPGVGFRY